MRTSTIEHALQRGATSHVLARGPKQLAADLKCTKGPVTVTEELSFLFTLKWILSSVHRITSGNTPRKGVKLTRLTNRAMWLWLSSPPKPNKAAGAHRDAPEPNHGRKQTAALAAWLTACTVSGAAGVGAARSCKKCSPAGLCIACHLRLDAWDCGSQHAWKPQAKGSYRSEAMVWAQSIVIHSEECAIDFTYAKLTMAAEKVSRKSRDFHSQNKLPKHNCGHHLSSEENLMHAGIIQEVRGTTEEMQPYTCSIW